MSKLFVIRHAEPALQGVFLGRTDPPLSSRGLQEAWARLRSLKVERVWSSPLLRARETAAAIPAPIEVLSELAEVAMGEWEGLPWEEVERRYPEAAQRKMQAWFEIEAPAGESWQSVRQRVARALERICKGPLPAAIVAHGGVNAEIHFQLLGKEPDGVRQGYCEIIEYEKVPGGWDRAR
jgi:broad specificity phosphatase PhoE